MRAGQHGVADFDGAHGARVTAVDARLAGQDLAANDACLDVEQHAFDLDAVELHALGRQAGLHGGVGFAAGLRAALLVADLVGRAQGFVTQCSHLGDQLFILGGSNPVPDGLAGFAHQLVDGFDGDATLLVAEDHGAQHHVFRQLLRLGLHHQHGGFGAGHDQIHLRILALGLAGVEHVLAIDVAHAGGTDGTVERNARHGQGGRRGDQGGDVGIDFGVQRHGVDDHMHVVVEAFGEQRADRTVDQAAGQGFQFAGLGFALEEAAGDLACGVGLLDVIDGQREEVLAGLGLLGRHHGGQHHGVIDVDQHGAGSLAGDLAGFHGDRVLAPLEGLGDFVEDGHCCS